MSAIPQQQDRDRWLAERRSGIGGTDISALLGLNPWKTPLDVWLDKTGRASDETGNEEAMYWGTVLEDAVARRYSELTGRRVQRVNRTLRLPDSVALANIDRAVINPEIMKQVRVREDGHTLTTDRILEVKTAHALARHRSDEWGEPGTDQVPEHYWLQVQWYLGITGAEAGDLAVLFGGQQMVIYTIPSDPALFAEMLDEAEQWWARHVVADTPPEPVTADEARRLWRRHTPGKTVAVDVTVARAVADLARIRQEIKDLEAIAKEREADVLRAFGDAEAIEYQGRRLATWKQNKPTRRTDWKALAEFLGARPEYIEKFTEEKPGARVLRLNRKEIEHV